MSLQLKWMGRIALFVVLLVAVVLGIKSFREPDLWWIMLTGEWIVQNAAVPTTDVFSFTHFGVPWLNVKWGYEVLCYGIATWLGPECIYLLQCVANLFMVVLLLRCGKALLALAPDTSDTTFRTRPLVLLGLLLILAGANHRMIGRPEMTTHVLTLLVIALFLADKHQPSKRIWWLVPVMALWVNMHEAYGTGMVIIITMLVGRALDGWLLTRSWNAIPRRTVLASISALAAVGLNPRGIRMLWHPVEIYTQLDVNKFTNENFDWTTEHYLQQEEPWLALAVLLLGLASLPWIARKASSVWWRALAQHVGAGYMALLGLFVVLGLGAYRNVALTLLVASPLALATLAKLEPRKKERYTLTGLSIVILCGAMFYWTIITDRFYDAFSERDNYGLYVHPYKNPVGAAAKIKELGLHGTSYGDMLTTAHLMWDLRPEYKSYIDLRDLDVYPAEFFQRALAATGSPALFEAEAESYGFQYAVVYRPEFPKLHHHLENSPDWQLHYVDPVAALFVKDGLQGQQDPFQRPPDPGPGGFAIFVNRLFNPLFDLPDSDVDIDLIAATYYLNIGRFELAASRAERSLSSGRATFGNYEKLGLAYFGVAIGSGDPEAQDKAYTALKRAAQLKPTSAVVHEKIGVLALRKNELKTALAHATKAAELDPSKKDIYRLLAECHSRSSRVEQNNIQYHSQQWLRNIQRAFKLDPNDVELRLKLGTFHCQRDQCEEAMKYLQDITQARGLTQDHADLLEVCRSKCGIP